MEIKYNLHYDDVRGFEFITSSALNLHDGKGLSSKEKLLVRNVTVK